MEVIPESFLYQKLNYPYLAFKNMDFLNVSSPPKKQEWVLNKVGKLASDEDVEHFRLLWGYLQKWVDGNRASPTGK